MIVEMYNRNRYSMAKDRQNNTHPIRAGGGLVWRTGKDGYEIAVVYRSRYDDWTLPKGKLKKGESFQEAALREVQEETGCEALMVCFAGKIEYNTILGPKIVRYWHMQVFSELCSVPADDVDQVRWLSRIEAMNLLTYPLETRLLRGWQGPGIRTDTE